MKPDLGLGFTLRQTIGGGFSASIGVGISKRFENVKPSVNFSATVYNSGVGTSRGNDGSKKYYGDFVISPALTVGAGTHAQQIALNTFNNNTATGVKNDYKSSFSLGTNFVFNNAGRNQRVGYAGFRANHFDFNFYNDVIPLLGDRDDRWWTGGGSANYMNWSVATDVFTGIRKVIGYEDNGNPIYDFDDRVARRRRQYIQDSNQQIFNSGQMIVSMRGLNGFSNIGFVNESTVQMWSQNVIHRILGIPTFKSTVKPSFGFYNSLDF